MNSTIKLTIYTPKGKIFRTFSFLSRASLDTYLKARKPPRYIIWA